MLKIGVTGGIGSGKSRVCKEFERYGIPSLSADAAARHLMENDPDLIQNIKRHFGENVYKNGRLDRPFLSSIVFASTEKLQLLNSIVHPATIAYSQDWMRRQDSPYVLKESAIFFESGTYKDMDLMLLVYARQEIRIQRVMQRDQVTETEVRARIQQQIPETEKLKHCDLLLINDGDDPIDEQVAQIHAYLTSSLNQ